MVELVVAVKDAIKELGPFAATVAAVLLGAGFVIYWNSRLVNMVIESAGETRRLANQIQSLSSVTIERNTVSQNAATESNLKVCAAVDKNTEATVALAEHMKKWGSDPAKLCGWREIVIMAAHEGLSESDLIRALKVAGKNVPKDAATHEVPALRTE